MTGPAWHRPARCNSSSCVEVAVGCNGSACVEVAFGQYGWEAGAGEPAVVAVRDGKNPDGPRLFFTATEWAAFVAGVQAGEAGLVGGGPVSDVRGQDDWRRVARREGI